MASSVTLPPHCHGAAEMLDKHFRTLREIAFSLLSHNEALRLREIGLMKELANVEKARDAFQEQCRQLSELVAELRDDNVAREGTR